MTYDLVADYIAATMALEALGNKETISKSLLEFQRFVQARAHVSKLPSLITGVRIYKEIVCIGVSNAAIPNICSGVQSTRFLGALQQSNVTLAFGTR